MKKEKDIDFSKTINIPYGNIITPKSRIRDKNLFDVKDITNSSLYMASQIDDLEHGLCIFDYKKTREAYFRATLAEICRLEDILINKDKANNFLKTDDPSLMIVKLLRNYQVHISSNSLSSGSIEVGFSGELAVYDSFIITNLNVKNLNKLRDAKHFSETQLSELIDYFDTQQKEFGVVPFLYQLILYIETYTINKLKLYKI
jgi:hypothetical protein